MNNQFLLKKKTQLSDQSQGGEFLSEPVQTLERGLKPFFFQGAENSSSLFSVFHYSISLLSALWLGPGPGGASYYKSLLLCYSWFDPKQNTLEILEEHLFPSSIQPKPPSPTSSG